MSIHANLQPVHRQAHRVAVALAAGLLLTATACSSTHETAASSTTTASTPVGPTTSVAPTTTVDPARESMLQGILDSHHAAGEFVGARIALRRRDGTITEATAAPRRSTRRAGRSTRRGLERRQRHQDVRRRRRAAARRGGPHRPRRRDRAVPARPCRGRTGSRHASCSSTPAGSSEYNDKPARAERRASARGRPTSMIAVAEAAGPARRAGRAVPLRQHQLHRARRDHREGHRPPLGRRGARRGSPSRSG